MKAIKTNEGGFTIVELIVTLIVAALLTSSLFGIHMNHTYLAQRSRDLALSNAYAEGKIEALRSKGFLGITTGNTTISAELPAELSSPKSAELQISQPVAGIKHVVITIIYTSGGLQRTDTYKTYIGELGVGQY